MVLTVTVPPAILGFQSTLALVPPVRSSRFTPAWNVTFSKSLISRASPFFTVRELGWTWTSWAPTRVRIQESMLLTLLPSSPWLLAPADHM